MYTRNYRSGSSEARDINLTNSTVKDDSGSVVWSKDSENQVPEGYSGTAILRESHPASEEVVEHEFGINGIPRQPLRRVKFKRKSDACDTQPADCMPQVDPCESSDKECDSVCKKRGILGGVFDFQIDDLILGALIILFMSQNSDDTMVLILAALFIIGFS